MFVFFSIAKMFFIYIWNFIFIDLCKKYRIITSIVDFSTWNNFFLNKNIINNDHYYYDNNNNEYIHMHIHTWIWAKITSWFRLALTQL